MALFLMAPIIAVSMAPPAPPAITCETMPPILRLPDCAAATIDGSANVTIWPSTPPPTKPEIMFPTVPRSNVGDALPVPTPPSASCDEVNQNLFHVNLPMSTNVFVVTSATLRTRTALSLLPSCCGFFQRSKYFAGVAIKPQTAKPSAVRSQRLCLRPPTCRVLGQHSLGVETG